MTERDLSADRAACDAATPGPWNVHQPTGCIPAVHSETETISDRVFNGNAPFIALARSALPYWLDEVERLRAELDWLRDEQGLVIVRHEDGSRALEFANPVKVVGIGERIGEIQGLSLPDHPIGMTTRTDTTSVADGEGKG